MSLSGLILPSTTNLRWTAEAVASSKSQWHALSTLKSCRYTNANAEFLKLHYGWDEHRVQRQMQTISGKKLRMRCAYILYMFWQSRGILCKKVPPFFCWQFICLPWEKKKRETRTTQQLEISETELLLHCTTFINLTLRPKSLLSLLAFGFCSQPHMLFPPPPFFWKLTPLNTTTS